MTRLLKVLSQALYPEPSLPTDWLVSFQGTTSLGYR